MFRLAFNLSFLVHLLGLPSVLVGIASSLSMIPPSKALSRRHRRLHADRNTAHDALSATTSEMLQGLRQIRFSSTERLWERRVLAARAHELAQFAKANLTLVYLTLTAHLAPVLLASTALSVYAARNGHLSAATAFASVSLFDTLHSVFVGLPGNVARLYES